VIPGPAGSISTPDRQHVAGRKLRPKTHSCERLRQQHSALGDGLQQFGAAFGDLQLRIDVSAKTEKIVLEPVKHALNLKLFGEPVARERLGVILPGSADHGAEDATRQLFPEVPTVGGTREIQRDLPIVETMVIRQAPQEQRMNQLVDEVRETLGLDHPLEASQFLQFVRKCPTAQILAATAKQDHGTHVRNYQRNQASQINGGETLEKHPSVAQPEHQGCVPVVSGVFSRTIRRKRR
jgi:hypothetical protein